MPKTITQVNTADNYTEQGGANINSAYQSKGGWVALPAQVLAQIQHSSAPDNSQGQEQWSDEFVLPSGAHYLQPGIIGIRFRSFTPGNPVAVSAAIFYRDEYAIQLGGSGISTPGSNVASLNFQHNDIAVATEPTADFEDESHGNNLVWTIVDDPANTRVKITPVWQSPTIFPHSISTGPTVDTMTGTQTAGVFLDQTFSLSWITAITSGSQTVFNTFHTNETSSRFNINDTGAMQWGPGNAATDTSIGRFNGANNLATSDTSIQVFRNVNTSAAFLAVVSGDTQNRWVVRADGTMLWGPGNAGQDNQLQRSTVTGVLNIPTNNLSIGPANVTSGVGGANAGTYINNGSIVITQTADTGGIGMTISGDTTDYRFLVTPSGIHNWASGSALHDTNLYRKGASWLVTDSYFTTGNAISANGTSASFGQGGTFGGNNTYSLANSWINGYVGGTIYWDGSNWQNQTFAGNNGWHMWAGRGDAGGAEFFSEPNTGAANRTYTAAQMQTKKLFAIDNVGILYVGQGIGGDTTISRQSAGQLKVVNQLSVNTNTANGAGTITSSDRIFSGAASTGGIWVDGGANQFFGSNSATVVGIYNAGWRFVIDNAGFAMFNSSYGWQVGVGAGASGSVAGTSITQNKITGSVTFTGQSNTASVLKTFIVTNSTVGANDNVLVTVNNGTTATGQIMVSAVVTGGSFSIVMLCNSANASVTYSFNYSVLKGTIT